MQEFLILAGTWLLIALAAVPLCLFRSYLKKTAKKLLPRLVARAEELFGAGRGAEKFAAAWEWLHTAMPAALDLFFSRTTVSEWIEEALEDMKALWNEVTE